MLDIELIRSDPEFVRTALLKRVDDVDLEPVLAADARRRKLASEVDAARSERNRQAKQIGRLKASGADTSQAQHQAAALGACSDATEPQTRALVSEAREEIDIVASALSRLRSIAPR